MADAKAKVKTLREEHRGAVPLTGGTGETFKWDAPGKQIQGRFLGLKDGSMGGQMVRIDTGTDIVVASAPEMLAQALGDVKPGTKVVIRYVGDQPSRKVPGQTYKAFEAIALPE